jgi:hypothetical protein
MPFQMQTFATSVPILKFAILMTGCSKLQHAGDIMSCGLPFVEAMDPHGPTMDARL